MKNYLEFTKPNDPEICTYKQLPPNIAFPFSAIMRVCHFTLVVFAFCSLPKETLRISRKPKARFSLLIKIPLRIEIFNTNICWISILFTTTFCYDPSRPNLQFEYTQMYVRILVEYYTATPYNSYMLYIVLLHFFKQFFGVAMEQGPTYKMCV